MAATELAKSYSLITLSTASICHFQTLSRNAARCEKRESSPQNQPDSFRDMHKSYKPK
jgi:hypothetical protein